MASEEPLELDMLAASLRVDQADLGTFVESLAAKLEEAIPSLTRVGRARQGIMGPKVVRTIAIDAGGERLELSRDGHDKVRTRRARLSGGIVLKTEEVDIDSWMASLTAALADEASHNERTRQALSRLLLD
jgi:hypothetical protein